MPRPLPETIAERSALREGLIALGYSDDGDRLYGRVGWIDADGVARRTAITIELTDAFPFGPPRVALNPDVAGSDPVPSTFHLEPNDTLCLFDSDTVVEAAAWRTADGLLARIAGWFAEAADGWPGDEDCDLERYLTPAGEFVTYDTSELTGITGTVATSRLRHLTRITARKLPKPKLGSRAQRQDRRSLAWVGDLGPVTAPIRSWSDLVAALPANASCVEAHIRGGYVSLLLLRYQRGGAAGILVVHAKVTIEGIVITGCEGADESLATRTLRSGAPANLLARQRIAIIGCGAIGSYTADLLFKAGVRHLTLIDPQPLRPGNLVRHIGSVDDVGKDKVVAVGNHLARSGLPVNHVVMRTASVRTPREAMDIVREHTLVVDATADARASSLLNFAAADVNAQLVSVCLQREGGIARVDRWPLGQDEAHLLPVPEQRIDGVRERGCGDLVSLTPPHSVSAAAVLATRVVLDVLAPQPLLPATVLEVLTPQDDPPYDQLGTVTAQVRTSSAA